MSQLCLVLSDWHCGQVFERPYNSYGPEIMLKRARQISAKLSTHPMISTRYSGLQVLIAGDMVDGQDIYSRQNSIGRFDTNRQIEFALEALSVCLRGLRDDLGVKVSVHCVPGNHGRMSKTSKPESNWDVALYRELSLSLRGERRIWINDDNTQEYLPLEIEGRKGVLSHYGYPHTGTPAYRMRAISRMLLHGAEWTVGGHYHTSYVSTVCDRVCINSGSLVGPSELSESLPNWDPPRQSFFAISRQHGIYGMGWLQWPLTGQAQTARPSA